MKGERTEPIHSEKIEAVANFEETLLCLVAAIIVEIINRETYGRGDRIH